jgi:hypothetical protein
MKEEMYSCGWLEYKVDAAAGGGGGGAAEEGEAVF